MPAKPTLQISAEDYYDMQSDYPHILEDLKAIMKKVIAAKGKIIVLQKYINAPPDLVKIIETEEELTALIGN